MGSCRMTKRAVGMNLGRNGERNNGSLIFSHLKKTKTNSKEPYDCLPL